MNNIPGPRPRIVLVMAVIAVLFGLLTLYSGGMVLFGGGPARAAAGAFVPFVLWFNFLAGFAYVAAGVGLYLWRHWAVSLSMLIALATLLVFGAFGLHILFDGAYETRTLGAMALRSTVWSIIAFLARTAWSNGGNNGHTHAKKRQ